LLASPGTQYMPVGEFTSYQSSIKRRLQPHVGSQALEYVGTLLILETKKMKKMFTAFPQVAVLSLVSAIALPAHAQSAGSNVVNVGWFHLSPQDSSDPLRIDSPAAAAHTIANTGATVPDSDTLGVAFTHFFTDNIAVTADAGIPPTFKLNGTGLLAGGELGEAKQWSPAVVAKWYFGQSTSKFRPFAGVGVTRVWFTDIELTSNFQQKLAYTFSSGTTTSGTSTASLSRSWAPVANIGAAYSLDKNWSLNLSVSYIPLKTDANITTTLPTGTVIKSSTSVTLNPIVAFLSVGYKF
jgi:outer membrane protein